MYCIWQIILIVCSTILTIPVRTGVFYSAATDITVSKYGHITLPVLKLSALLFPVPITSRLRLTFVQMCSVGQLKHWRTVFGNGEIIPSHFIKMFRTMFWFLICMEAVAYSQISYSEMGPWSVFSFFGSLLKSTYVEVIMSHYALWVIPLSKFCLQHWLFICFGATALSCFIYYFWGNVHQQSVDVWGQFDTTKHNTSAIRTIIFITDLSASFFN